MAGSVEKHQKRIRYMRRHLDSKVPVVGQEDKMLAKIGEMGQLIDGFLPPVVQKVLNRMFPDSVTLQRLQALNDYRQEHNIPVSRIPL